MRFLGFGVISVCLASSVTFAAPLIAQDQKPIAGCPSGGGWILGTVEDFGIDPAIASGIPSLDGNNDGLTCGKLVVLGNGFLALTFRDNNVK